MHFTMTLFGFLTFLSVSLANPLTGNISPRNATLHHLSPRDIICEPFTFPEPLCHVFSLAYQETGTNFIAGLDEHCTPFGTHQNIPGSPSGAGVDVGHTNSAWVEFIGWNIAPLVQYQKGTGSNEKYGLGYPGTVNCETGNNDDTGLYCIAKFPC